MGSPRLGRRKTAICEAVLGQPVALARVFGNRHYLAICWVDREHAALVDYRTRTVVEPVKHQGRFVGWFADPDTAAAPPKFPEAPHCTAEAIALEALALLSGGRS